MSMAEIIQLGALGILGVIVITGFSLFKWAVQKWLPSYVDTIKECTKDVCNSLNELTSNAKEVKINLAQHDKDSERFDGITTKMLEDLSNLSKQQDNVIKILDRQTKVLEKICENMVSKK